MGDTVVQVSTGGTHTCFLFSSGHVKCVGSEWGANVAPGGVTVLGAGPPGTVPTYGCIQAAGRCTFKPVEVLGLSDAVEISTGLSSACARKTNGTVVCWGGGTVYGGNTPTLVAGRPDALQIAIGGGQSQCARKSDGTVACWGAIVGGAGTTVLPTISDAMTISLYGGTLYAIHAGGQVSKLTLSTSTDVAGLTDATQISTAGHTCAVRSAGQVVCWGLNAHGELGDGTVVGSTTPVVVTVPGVISPKQIISSRYSTCALMPSGHVTCWGAGGDVVGIDDALSLSTWSAVDDYCAVRPGGRVTCWGPNVYGELGNGNQAAVPPNAPTDVVF